MVTNQLLQGISIGSYRLQTPTVFGPHRANFPEGHLPGSRRVAYYEERAKNSVGMIVVEGAMVCPGEYPYDWALNVWEENAVAAYEKLAATLHKYHTVVIGGLNHYGMQGDSSVTRKPLWAPSPVAEVNSNEIPKIMDEEDIQSLVRGFAFGAEVMKAAGLDGAEVNAGQYSLLRQFLSGLTNFRDDAYGGSLENKCRVVVEVLREVRRTLGTDRLLGLRLCADEYAPWGGIQPSEAKTILNYLAAQVPLDYVAFENGGIYSTNMTFGGDGQPEDYGLAAAREVGSEQKELPQIVGGSLVSLPLMEQALQEFSLIDITRSLIADPKLLKKVQENKEEEIVPCILCKRGCHTHVNTNPVVACSMNPRAGEESKQEFLFGAERKNLAVIGGGPAGMMAALSGLRVGHCVTLFEKEPELGGHYRQFAASSLSLQPTKVLTYFLKNLTFYEQSGQLTIQLQHVFSPEEAAGFDGMVVATGACYEAGAYAGDSKAISLEQILKGKIPSGHRAVVEDALGDQRAVTACRLLIQAGYTVFLVTKNSYQGETLVKIGEFADWFREMHTLGIESFTDSFVGYAGQDRLEIVNKYTETPIVLPGVDIVVSVAAPRVNQKLWRQLIHCSVPVILAGDAVAPRNLQAAIREGYAAIGELR